MNKQIQLQKNEQVVLERRYDSLLPLLLIVIGAIIAVLGFIFGIVLMTEIEDPSPFLLALIGVVLIVLGNYLKPKGEFLLIVTNKRVVQDGPFGQFVVLPLNRIVSVSGNGKMLNVSSAGGRITMSIPDSVSACNTVSGLLNQLQEKVEVEQHRPVAKSAKTSAPQPSSFSVQSDNYWVCATCDTKNMEHREDCWNCGSTREVRATQEDPAVQSGWICHCGIKNAESATACKGCGAPRPTKYKKCQCGAMVLVGKKCPLCGKEVR